MPVEAQLEKVPVAPLSILGGVILCVVGHRRKMPSEPLAPGCKQARFKKMLLIQLTIANSNVSRSAVAIVGNEHPVYV